MAIVEMLVVLQMAAAPGLAEEIRSRCDVVAAMPPRLFVVEIDETSAAALASWAGVAAVVTDPQVIDVTPPLTEGERLFAAGWATKGVKKGERAGEGLPWDAPGFEPPDAPRR